jgi:hypothetical protein
MLRNLIAAASTAVLCLASVMPLAARDVRHDAPRGASATLNLRVPLGPRRTRERPSWGVTAGYGQPTGTHADGRRAIREWRVADLRFGGDGLSRAELASFNLANPGSSRRLRLEEEGMDKKMWLWLPLLLLAGGAAFLILDSDSESEPDPTPTPLPNAG